MDSGDGGDGGGGSGSGDESGDDGTYTFHPITNATWHTSTFPDFNKNCKKWNIDTNTRRLKVRVDQ